MNVEARRRSLPPAGMPAARPGELRLDGCARQIPVRGVDRGQAILLIPKRPEIAERDAKDQLKPDTDEFRHDDFHRLT